MIALVFALLFILSCFSCDKENVTTKERENILNIDSECVYSEAEISSLSNRMVSLFEIAVSFYDPEAIITDIGREELKASLCNSFFKKLEKIPIYPSEITSILDITEIFLNEIKQERSFSKFASFYTETSLLLGNDRNQKLCFISLESFLHFSERDNADELLNVLTNKLGEKAFSDVLSVFSFCSSITFGTYPNMQNSYAVNDAEILMILKRQAKYYSELNISPEQWQLSVYLAEELLPSADTETLYSEIGSTLKSAGFYESAALSINAFLDLYSAAIDSMTKDDIALLHNDSSYLYKVTCRALSRVEPEFRDFINVLAESATTDISVGYEEIEALGYGQKYLDFIDNMKYSNPPELFDAISSYANSTSISSYGELNRSILLYVYKLSPALAFAFENRLAEGINSK